MHVKALKTQLLLLFHFQSDSDMKWMMHKTFNEHTHACNRFLQKSQKLTKGDNESFFL